jgi:GNAT superfamily N-acetyltransferase
VKAWHEEPIGEQHDRDECDCGEEARNEFMRRYGRKSHDLGDAKTFLAIDDGDNKTILGFYSLSPASIEYARTPEIVKRGLARHDVPGFRLARLAVDRKLQGQGLGEQLLLAAARRCLMAAAEVGGVVLFIDAKNEKVAGWYASYGAVPLLDAPLPCSCRSQQLKSRLRRRENTDDPKNGSPKKVRGQNRSRTLPLGYPRGSVEAALHRALFAP